MANAKKNLTKVSESHSVLFPDQLRNYNPYWQSSLFSDVYLKNDVQRDYPLLWNDDGLENTTKGFGKFYQGFQDLAIKHEKTKLENWNEASTVSDWIVQIMELLGSEFFRIVDASTIF
jgi:hypothetical protein